MVFRTRAQPLRLKALSRVRTTANDLYVSVEGVVDVCIVVPEIDIFASSTGKFNIITLDHTKKLEDE